MELLLATRNAHKTREFAKILGEEFYLRDLSTIDGAPIVEETGNTFEENAILKAMTASKTLQSSLTEDRQWLVIADDSGLEVVALGGAPGIFSARYAGENATDERNVAKLLYELGGADDRSARFRCAIALARNGKLLRTFDGAVEGAIVDLPRGEGGFGYDPIFRPNGYRETFGELADNVKNRISHRAKAASQLAEFLRVEA